MGSSAMMDFVGSMMVFAMLILTINRVQVNLNSTMYYNTYNYMTQNYALQLSKTIEFDFHKAGYRGSGNPVITAKVDTAEANRIRLKYYLLNSSTLRTITYRLGARDATSENPRDSILYRTENGTTIPYAIGVTEFRLKYFKSNLTELTAPVTGANLDSIHAIQVYFRVESLAPIILPDATQYISVFWEKLIYPRNLGNLR